MTDISVPPENGNKPGTTLAPRDVPEELRHLRDPRDVKFVMEYTTNGGRRSAAAEAAGYVFDTREKLWNFAARLIHRQDIREAIISHCRASLLHMGPEAIAALREQLGDSSNPPARMRAVAMILDRVDPPVQKISGEIKHTHTIDHEAEALNQVRTLRALGVAREKLVEIYGDTGLARLEAKLTPEAKVIEGDFQEAIVEVKEAGDVD